jgi:hypothetical protein
MFRRNTFFIWVIAAILLAGAGWWFVSPLFINNVVDEAFPFEMPSESELANMTEAELLELEADFESAIPDEDTLADLSPEDEAKLEEMVQEVAATVMVEKNVEEPMPETTAEWTLVSQGEFAGVDAFHLGSGNVGIYQQGDQYVVRFENFSVTNGPALHVVLAKHPSPSRGSEIDEGYLDLGTLKGNLGDQNYNIPTGTVLSDYQSVVIYCVPFHAVFSSATLN